MTTIFSLFSRPFHFFFMCSKHFLSGREKTFVALAGVPREGAVSALPRQLPEAVPVAPVKPGQHKYLRSACPSETGFSLPSSKIFLNLTL